MLGDLQGRCLEALHQCLRKTGAIHTRGDGAHVRLVNSIMIRNTKKHRGLITMDFLSKASTTIEKTMGFKPTIEIKAFRVCDGYSLPDEFNAKVERGQNLIRELALQGQLLDADDANNVIDLVIQILAAESFGEQAETLFHAVVAEWLQRSGKEEFEIEWTISGWITNIANARETLQPAAAASARSALHVRRKQTPLIAFKSARIQVSHQDASSVLDLLQNVDTQGTGARGLVLVCRLLWPPQVAEVHAFIKQNYSGEQSDGLHDDDSFDRVWKTPVTDNAKYALESALSERIQIAVESHPFIHSCLPAIMGQPVASYTKHSRELLFTLDFMPKMVEYRLDYTTGEITSSEGLGVLHSIYRNVRAFFLEDGGVQALAELLRDEKIGDAMRFDADEQTYWVYVSSTGLWCLAKKDEATTVASAFLKSVLGPIKHLAEFVGTYAFDWLRGTYAPVVDSDEDLDNGGEDVNSGGESEEIPAPCKKKTGTARSKQAGKKTKFSTQQWTGPQSHQTLKSTIFKFVETPKHTAEVLKPLQHRLAAPFLEKLVPHLLPCPNGVVDLRTGILLPKAAPGDLYTTACATAYDPEADIAPAQKFFDNFFSPEAYDDQEALVRCVQQWFGYCLTLETRLEICVWFYGEGSNGKSKMTELIAAVLGGGIHADVPMASHESVQRSRRQQRRPA